MVGLCAAMLAVATPASSTASGYYYHHLGAGTVGDWTGVVGRLTVRDPAVRAGTHDFVATRFMAKRESGGRTAWLEAGWAETGWSGGGRQRVYTYDTDRRAWTFYNQYELTDGDNIWISVHTTRDGVWEAWLWWRDGWHLLTSLRLGASRAQLEQYVEVHVDGDGKVAVPRIAVDNVQVRDGDAVRYWREADVRTASGGGSGGYCLDWATRFDTWTAGTC
ncbi:hypothetical protein GCM10023170_009410 [Phytohabitans houttuyneae]|uniref:Calcium-binding protein n=1 Tax=Phytohabitans houttuyneae TaxID=1076126 RepID=A0A6V8KC68_9ACTN|nr:hypothetical protein Phou_035070 [Phytohabitans houttuyneae]